MSRVTGADESIEMVQHPARKNTIPVMRPTDTDGPKVEDIQRYSGSGKRLGGIRGLVLLHIAHARIMLTAETAGLWLTGRPVCDA